MRRFLLSVLITLAFTSVVVTPLVAAEPLDAGARLSGFFSGSFGSGGTAPALGASAGYRFTRHVGLEFEVAYVPNLDFGENRGVLPVTGRVLPAGSITGVPSVTPLPPRVPIPFPFPFVFRTTGRAVTFVTNFVGEFPTGVRWLRPYVLGGGGLGNVSLRVNESVRLLRGISFPGGVPLPVFPLAVRSHAETALALTTGGGVEFQIWGGLAISGEVRYLHLFGEARDFNMTRVGTRVSYRF